MTMNGWVLPVYYFYFCSHLFGIFKNSFKSCRAADKRPPSNCRARSISTYSMLYMVWEGECFVIKVCDLCLHHNWSAGDAEQRQTLRPPNSAIILVIGGPIPRSSLHQPPSHVCQFAISSTGPEMPRPIVTSRPSYRDICCPLPYK